MLSLLDASVKVPAPTSIVVAPSPVGVKVAVYVVPFTFAAKLDKFPPAKVISPSAKLVVTSPASNVRAKVVSFDVEPSATSAAVMVIEGPVLSGALANQTLYACMLVGLLLNKSGAESGASTMALLSNILLKFCTCTTIQELPVVLMSWLKDPVPSNILFMCVTELVFHPLMSPLKSFLFRKAEFICVMELVSQLGIVPYPDSVPYVVQSPVTDCSAKHPVIALSNSLLFGIAVCAVN